VSCGGFQAEHIRPAARAGADTSALATGEAMSSTTHPTGSAGSRAGLRLSSRVILPVLATSLALWLGLTAPGISPVAPPGPATQTPVATSAVATAQVPEVPGPPVRQGGRR
jgi:hypothetical protein